MKKIKSVVQSSSLIDDLKSMGLHAHAGVIEQAVSNKIESILEDEGCDDSEDSEYEEDYEDSDAEELEDVLEDEGVNDTDIDEESEDDVLADSAVGLDEKVKYSPKQLKKLKAIATECLRTKTSVTSAKALLTAIATYEESR